MRATGVDAVSLDTAAPMDWAAKNLGCAVQGNLDPIALIAGGAALDRAVDDILQATAGKPHIFNLGHGILPETPIAHVEQLLKRIRGMKLAVVLFNLGGPDSPEAVEPFLRNLFSDPAIISLPAIIRLPLARLIARRRAPMARKIYEHIGGVSPIFAETRKQADALETALSGDGVEAKAFVAMRCWHPFSDGAARAVKAFNPDKIVLLPLYPQYSTTTTASSIKDWHRAAKKAGLDRADIAGVLLSLGGRLCCRVGGEDSRCHGGCTRGYFLSPAAVGAWPAQAHDRQGRPLSMAGRAKRRRHRQGAGHAASLEPVVCYQSKVGRLEWIGPATDAEIRRAGADGKGVIVAPIAFVSEHSETLVELDIEYRHLAAEAGVPDYRRAATVGSQPRFHRRAGGSCAPRAGRQDCHLWRGTHLSGRAQTLRYIGE